MYTKCFYHKCESKSSEISMFRFPIHNRGRLLQWIRNSGNTYLYSLNNDELKHRYICARHFPPSSIHKNNVRSRLIGPAIPVHFQSVEAGQGSSNTMLMETADVDIKNDMQSLPEVLEVKIPTKFYGKSAITFKTEEETTSPLTLMCQDVSTDTPTQLMDKTEVECKTDVPGPSSSTDEDTIISKNKQKNRGRKRKRCSSSSDDGPDLPYNTFEMERTVQASAVKNNLDENCVRKILKKVVTNDHVLALVKLREEEDSGSEDKNVQPKLTRAKAKELKKVSPRSAPWDLENLELTPINQIPVKTRPEVKALIAQELPEDEDDEEYEPTHDDVPSDDDHDHSCSDVDSQPRTPATPASQSTPSPKVLKDGPFKVPQDVSSARRKLNVGEEEATIALRTRSKLSLSTTTIEHIESSFIPPDEIHPPVDNLWSQFLSGCLDPGATHEEDDEADPEYNAAADENAMDEDEDFLGSSLIKISKKELNDLVTELFNVMPATDEELTLENLANSVLTDTSQTEVPRWDGKTEPLSDEESSIMPSKRLAFEKENTVRFSPGKSEMEEPRPQNTNHVPCERIEPMSTRASARARESAIAVKDNPKVNSNKSLPSKRGSPEALHICIEERSLSPEPVPLRVPPSLRKNLEPVTQTVHIKVQAEVVFTSEQLLILQQQLRMHIQLATSNFIQLFIHPLHWRMGPAYKDYLETLERIAVENKDSVVNVCNLKPALQVMRNWKESVSKDIPENIELVEFMNDQVEKSRRRFAQNCIYQGDFHETLKALVANSPVFLYPYLLPSMPYKADVTKRILYLRSEDELIVLGLDQFWKYMEDNLSIFKKPKVVNSRHRWGLATALQLVCKHMLPWMTPKQLAAHVTTMRIRGDAHNPIYNYFTNNELPKVQHSILPFDPALTLYEQPGHEMPRLWVRYLAKSSKRFKNLLSRRHHVTGAVPTGVPVQSVTSQQAVRLPLPDDFTKEIKCTRNPQDPMTDDLLNTNDSNADNNDNNDNIKRIDEVPLKMYKFVTTSKGSFLVPLEIVTVGSNNTGSITPSEQKVIQVTTKLSSSTGTVTTPAEVASKFVSKTTITKTIPTEPAEDPNHCSCCILLRKMVKRQTVITEFFRKDKISKKCYCSEVKYPKVTNKLRLLSNNFKNNSGLVFHELERRLEEVKKEAASKTERFGVCTLDELVAVTMFQLKILSRSLMSKFSYLKVRCKNLLTKFNPDTGDPIQLANALFKSCQKEMIDLYMDFLEFLTSEQADKLDKFKDYFVRNCAKDLMNEVEVQVHEEKARARILAQLRRVFADNDSSACQICSYLLESMAGYEPLARYTFQLFPHTKPPRVMKASSNNKSAVAHITITQEELSEAAVDEEAAGTAMDCEDNRSSISEEVDENAITAMADQPNKQENIDKTIEIKIEPDVTMDIEDSRIVLTENPDADLVMITLEEEIKEEPIEHSEWKRDEDKLILEVLKQQLTPEERKDNIPEMLEEKNVFGLIADNMSHKTKDAVRERVLFILSLLVRSES